MWVRLTDQLGRAAGRGHPDWVSDLPLARLVGRLEDALRDGLTESRTIPSGNRG